MANFYIAKGPQMGTENLNETEIKFLGDNWAIIKQFIYYFQEINLQL